VVWWLPLRSTPRFRPTGHGRGADAHHLQLGGLGVLEGGRVGLQALRYRPIPQVNPASIAAAVQCSTFSAGG